MAVPNAVLPERRVAGAGRWRAALLALSISLAPAAAPAVERSQGELRERDAFRVCADPADLPFSNRAGEGFENKIAELFAKSLGLPLQYTWHPQTMGFIRNTLRAHRCDVIMGISAGHELVQNTRSYYRSVYVLVYRAADRDRFSSLDSPLARIARIGVVANTPPARLLAAKGLFSNIVSYGLVVDTRVEQPAKQAILDLAAGRLDMALIWGPIAGYWAKRSPVPLAWVPLQSDKRRNLPMDFKITMGVRHGEREWLKILNGLIRKHRREIQEILLDYGVPLLDRRGRLITRESLEKKRRPRKKAERTVPEPDGYRTADYHAPVPATLAGATVLDTPALVRLLAETRPLLVDVYPAARRPEGRDSEALWIPPERKTLPGAAWLPNVGLGVLPEDLANYFAAALEQLTGGDRMRPLVFFCNRNCWMSWNAAKRALRELGYERVYWYPEGVDGWEEAGLALTRTREFELSALAEAAGGR